MRYFCLLTFVLALLCAVSSGAPETTQTLAKRFESLDDSDDGSDSVEDSDNGSDSDDDSDDGEDSDDDSDDGGVSNSGNATQTDNDDDDDDSENSENSDEDSDDDDDSDDGEDSDSDDDDDGENDYNGYVYNRGRGRPEEEAEEAADDGEDANEKSNDRAQSRNNDVEISDDLIDVESVASETPGDTFRLRVDNDEGLKLRVETSVEGVETDFRAEFIRLVEYDSEETSTYLFGSSTELNSVDFSTLAFGPFTAQADVTVDDVLIKSWSTVSGNGQITITGRMPVASVTVDGLPLSPNRMKIDVIIDGYQYITDATSSLALVARLRYTTGSAHVKTRDDIAEPTEIYSGAGVFNWRTTATAVDASGSEVNFHVAASPTFPVMDDASDDVEDDETERLMSFSFMDQSNAAKIVWDPEVGISYSAPAVLSQLTADSSTDSSTGASVLPAALAAALVFLF